MDTPIRSKSLALTLLIHSALILILLFTFMNTTIPPFPEEGGGGGVLVNIGMVEEASGTIQPMSENIVKEQVTEKSKPAEENYATQDVEDASIAKQTVKDPKPSAPVKNNTVKPTPVVKERVTDQRAIYKGRTTASSSEGTGSGHGDQGQPNGDPNSRYNGKGGTGTGTGTGNGEGDGSGTGKGNGVSFSLSGRAMIRTPQINDRSQDVGKVVVEITVDKEGNVVSASPGGRGSTTSSALLSKLAKEAAMKAKFNRSEDAADIQRGTISFNFVVQ